MDEFKPEDELKPDPSDRRAGRSRQSSGRDSEPQINFDDVDVDGDERRPSRGRKVSDEQEEEYFEAGDEPVERRPRKRKKAPVAKPASRQYLMMGLGILVLLLLIIGIGSALKSPSSPSGDGQTAGGERNIDLSGGGDATSNQANGAQPAPGSAPANQDASGQQAAGNQPQDVSLPPISSTPTEGQNASAPQGQQRMEVQGDLNNALTQQQGQMDSAVANSTLPTEPATVAPIRGGSAQRQPTHAAETATAAPRTERRHSEPVQQSRPQATVKSEPKRSEPVQRSEPVKRSEAPKRSEPAAVARTPVKTETAKPAEVAKPVEAAKPAASSTAQAPAAATAAPAASGGSKTTGNVGALKSAPSSHYTLQLSSSSNYDNLNNWAKKENVKNYVVYQTTRNGQPWYVLVSGVYATKDDAKRAVSSLPADVQAKNPWAKPVRQVQADLK